MTLVVCLNPVIQHTLFFPALTRASVNRAYEKIITASGKGVNVTRVLTQLGSPAVHLTHLGGPMKDYFLSLCHEENLPVEHVTAGSDVRFCITAIDLADKSTTELVEESDPVTPGTEQAMLDKFHALVNTCGNLVISGTKAAGYTDSFIPEMVKTARELGKNIVLDIHGPDIVNSLEYSPDCIKPNIHEFISTFFPEDTGAGKDMTASLLKRIYDKALAINREYGTIVILTRGRNGADLVTHNRIRHFDALPVTAVNTTGCGDAFTAGYVHSLFCQKENDPGALTGTENALRFALECAARAAETKIPGSIARYP